MRAMLGAQTLEPYTLMGVTLFMSTYDAPVAGAQESAETQALFQPAVPCCSNPGCDSTASRPKLSKCGRCQAAAYCGRACQQAHWRAGHKQVCNTGLATGNKDQADMTPAQRVIQQMRDQGDMTPLERITRIMRDAGLDLPV